MEDDEEEGGFGCGRRHVSSFEFQVPRVEGWGQGGGLRFGGWGVCYGP